MTHKKKKAPNNTQNKNKNQHRNKGGGGGSRNSNLDIDHNNNKSNQKHNQILCAHYDKAINLNGFRKSINHISNLECCRKNSPSSSSEKNSLECAKQFVTGSDLYICTQCGTLVCLHEHYKNGQDSVSHAHEHFATPRSDCHALFLQLSGDILYCIPCGLRLSTEGSKVMSLVSLIKKAKSNWSTELLEFFSTGKSLVKKSNDDESAERKKSTHQNHFSGGRNQPGKNNGVVVKREREVRGFSNLGNTCFFNSVMQNVMQTSWLKLIVENFSTPYNVEIDPKHKLKISQIGDMTSSLAQLYSTYFNGSNHCIAPKMVFQSLCQFCPMFKSREQQDSQEMFSCLVNGLFEEDEKRVKDAIMARHGLGNNGNMKRLDDMTKASIKREWKQMQRLNPISAVFGGMLTKYIKCNHCSNINCKSEPFISLSLSLGSAEGGVSSSSNNASSFASPRKPNSSSFSKDTAAHSPTVQNRNRNSKGHLKRRKAFSENKPAAEVAAESALKSDSKHKTKPTADISETTKPVSTPLIVSVNQNSFKPEPGQAPIVKCEEVDFEIDIDEDPDIMLGDFFGDLFDEDVKPIEAVDLSHNSAEIDGSLNDSKIMTQLSTNLESVSISKGIDISQSSFSEFIPEVTEVSPKMSSPVFGAMQTVEEKVEESASNVEESLDRKIDCTPTPNSCSKSTDSAYASQTSLATVQSVSDAVLVNKNPESPPISNICSAQNGSEVIDENSNSQGQNTQRSDSFRDKSEDKEDAKSESSMGLDDLFASTPSDTDQVDENGGTDAVNGPSKAGTEYGDIYSNRSRKEEAVSKSVSSFSIADSSPMDPLEALYMSTLSDGLYQPQENEMSIMSLLKSFINLEYLTGCNKIKCDKCSVNDNRNLSDACVWYRITSSPSVLVLQIKRFAQFGLRLQKLNTPVTIQQVLDIAPFCSADCPTESKSKDKSRILYRLHGIVEHIGSLRSGHYTAYICQRGSSQPPEAPDIINSLLEKLNGGVSNETTSDDQGHSEARSSERDDWNNVWYHVSDSSVKQVPLSKVLSSSPYMLFYEKVI